MVIFGPWAFGTTQWWSIWMMNTASYTLGTLWMLKRVTVWAQGFRPPAWGRSGPTSGRAHQHQMAQVLCGFTPILGMLTAALLLYCLMSAINARATFNPITSTFEYYHCLPWLPHSFDGRSTWFAFWTYLGLACSFWSIRDWLLGKSAGEQLAAYEAETGVSGVFGGHSEHRALPARLSRLLTLLTFNGGLLAAESVVQRLAGSPQLLFLGFSPIHHAGHPEFGPYAYRANGAEYLNLLWPVCLGSWWTIFRKAAPAKGFRHLLLICVGLMATAAMISARNGG